MDNLIIHLLKFIYRLSEEPYLIINNQDLFDIFRYNWLDNQELIYYLNARQNFKGEIIPNKEHNKHFLKIYKDAYDAQIFKIGRYINYNFILKIGSKELTDYEKRILNQARAIYSESQYKKTVDRYFNLIEEKCRQWLFNVMQLLFGSKWKEYLPSIYKDQIKKRKISDKKKYGTQIGNENKLYYLDRGSYSGIFLYNKLWNKFFYKILGMDNKDIISKLEQISNIANKVKHNLNDIDLYDFAPNIKEGLEDTCNILKILNRGYKNILNTNNIHYIEPQIYLCYSAEMDLNELDPFEIKVDRAMEIYNQAKSYLEKEIPIRKHYIDIGDRSSIERNYSCSYREFLANLCYLIKFDKLEIKEFEGSCLMFDFK